MLPKIPFIIKWVYPRRIWNMPRGTEKAIYLSFDDGPIPEVTPWVLEQLQNYRASGSFFCIGDNVRKYPELLKRILEEGHAVGNHTHNHLNGWKTRTPDYLENVQKAEETMESRGSDFSRKKLFRPPYGRMSSQQAKALRRMDYRIIMWDVLSMDYEQRLSPQRCYQNVVKNVRPGSIVVFHDSLKAETNLKYVLPKVLQYFSEKGFEFKALQ